MHWLLYRPGEPIHVACLVEHPFPRHITATTDCMKVTCEACQVVIRAEQERATGP